MRILKLALIGFGNAGRAFAKLVAMKQQQIEISYGYKILTTVVATASRGNLVCENGIDLEKALRDIDEIGRFRETSMGYSRISTTDIIEKADYDVLIEITPLNIFTGQPAIDNIRLALNRRKHVVTANKGPIAWAYQELKKLSIKQGVIFLYESTVMDGTPVFNMVQETLPMCKIIEFNGILNTTTNFVLDEMAKGNSFDKAIEEGKAYGFVEADPKLDIEGFDAAAKTAALINVLMGGCVTPNDIKRKGIENITQDDIIYASKKNKVIKLICKGKLLDGKAIGEVMPDYIEKEHIFATVKGTSSILTLKTDLMGEITIIEQNPQIEQTGYGIFSDLLRILAKIKQYRI